MKKNVPFVLKVFAASLFAIAAFFFIRSTEQTIILLSGVCLTVFAVVMRRRLKKSYDELEKTASA
jgi:hypothetical protein